MAAPAAVLSILVKANTGKATQGLARFNTTLGATESSANKATKALTTFAKVGVIGVGVGVGYAVKKAADFEEQIDSLGAVTDATAKQMERFRKQAMKAGADTKFSALEAAKAQTELAKGGLKVKQILDGGLNSALALAAAGELELAEAAEATVNAMKLFGLRGRDAMKVADGFATAANQTTASVEDFAMSLKMGGSAAKAAGLGFSQTVAVLEALAETGIRGSDAGTSLKAMLVQLAAPTAKQEKLTKKLGLSFFDQAGHMKQLPAIAEMLRTKLKGMTDQQRLATVKVLAGTDGMRALLSIYDAGPKKMEAFEKGLEKTGTAAEVAAKKQDNLKGKLEQLRGAVETAAIGIGTRMLPALTRAAEDITKIINDPKLTDAKKFELLAKKAGEAFEAAIPVIAKAAAAAAPIVAKSFVEGFLAAGVWGRLAIGAFLLSKMGGPPAFMRAGTTAGVAMSNGVASGMATGGMKGKLVGLMKKWGPSIGVALGLAIAPEVFKASKSGLATQTPDFNLPKKQVEPLGALIKPLGDFERKLQGLVGGSINKLQEFGETAESAFKKAAKAGDALKLGQLAGQARSLASQFPEHAAELGRFADAAVAAARKAGGAFTDMRKVSAKSLQQIQTKTANVAFDIQNTLGFRSEAARKALAKNFAGAAQAVRRYMNESGKTTKKGLELIERYMIMALKEMGFSRKEAITLREGRDPFTGKAIGGKQNLTGKQRGGPINMGAPSGDSVPALLERGEYVVNRKAVQKVGRGALDRLNFGAAPRFQGGGIVELLHPGNDPKGHGDHLHVAMNTVQGIVALGKKLQGLGWIVGEHPAFGGVGGHTAGSYHYKGLAIDVNWPDAGAERAKIAALLPMLGGGLGGLGGVAAIVAPVLNRLIAEGPASPLKGIVQGALDIGQRGAQSVINKGASLAGGVEGAEMGNFSGPWTQVMASIAGAKGWNLGDWNRLVQKESGGNPRARNPSSGAFGLGQFLGATARSYAKYGALSTDPVQQIQAMAKYISDRYGNPSAALAFHNANNWYSRGGAIGMQWGGSPFPTWGRGASGPKQGNLAKRLTKAFKTWRTAKSPKIRKDAIEKLLGQIKGVELPAKMRGNLAGAAKNANVFGEYADRASQLTTEDADGNPIPGIVGGKSQTQWLTDQLAALFKWRNALIRAAEIAAAKRLAIEQAKAIAEKAKETLTARLKELRKKPKQNKKQITALTRQREALTGKIIPALTTKSTSIGTARNTMISSLEDVQGIGSPMKVLNAASTMPGALGGQILDVQMSLRDLNAPRVAVTDSASDTSERDSLLTELLREANLRTAVSEAQFKVFKNMPQFATGGIVPGVTGAPTPAVVHAGEGVFTRDQMAAMGGGSAPSVTINVAPGMEWLKKFISVQVDDATRTQSRRASRRLPGGGGGLIG